MIRHGQVWPPTSTAQDDRLLLEQEILRVTARTSPTTELRRHDDQMKQVEPEAPPVNGEREPSAEFVVHLSYVGKPEDLPMRYRASPAARATILGRQMGRARNRADGDYSIYHHRQGQVRTNGRVQAVCRRRLPADRRGVTRHGTAASRSCRDRVARRRERAGCVRDATFRRQSSWAPGASRARHRSLTQLRLGPRRNIRR